MVPGFYQKLGKPVSQEVFSDDFSLFFTNLGRPDAVEGDNMVI